MVNLYKQIIPVVSLLAAGAAYAGVNIAVIAPKEGEHQKSGYELISGVTTAVEEINSQGGLNGEKINLITVDDQCDDRLAVSTAQMMAVNANRKDKMSLVIGPYCSNSFDNVANIYAKANIFQIVPIALSESDAKESHKGLVKMVGYKDNQAKDFFKYYTQAFEGQKVAIIYDSGIRSIVDLAASVQSEFRKAGVSSLLKAFNFRNYADNYDEMVEDITRNNIHIAYILGKPKNIAKISKKLKNEERDFVIFTNKYQAGDDFSKTMGSAAENTYLIALPSLKDSPDFAETLVQLRLHGVELEGLAVYGYSAVKLWEEIVNKADSFKYDKLAKALEEDKIETGWGEVMFTNGNPQNSINYGIYKFSGGEYTQVY
ncbi:MAG: ABC transporter substrate-binding protein [Alphaproteobacteria bacterium]|nr:ABC transporter substrate-binding protein [Alphaproteobacteria bacterium]